MSARLYTRLKALNSVFTDTDRFGETITIFPEGDRERQRTFDGVFFLDGEQGSNEVFGDGAPVGQSVLGESERRTGILEAPTTEKIGKKDVFVIPNPNSGRKEIWHYYRYIGRDKAMQATRLIRAEKSLTRQPHLRPTRTTTK
jgi:hypothetical protein